MKTLFLDFPDGRRVPVRIGSGLLAGAPRAFRRAPERVVIVADTRVPSVFCGALSRAFRRARIPVHLLGFRGGERAKNLATLERLARQCVRLDLGRDGALVALGGGVAGDLTGLLASLYLRGIPFLQCPTTLLAQADAALGGKCAVDLPEGKNLLGAFHQSVAVLCDLDTLKTLPGRRLREGLAEIVKCALLDGPGAFAWLERHAVALVRREPKALEQAISLAVRVKAAHVGGDERDIRGLRERLNLGHTLAHAAEAVSGYSGLTHGEAVAAGLVAACDVARSEGVLEDQDLPGRLALLLRRLGLPTGFPRRLPAKRLVAAAARDKKVRGGRIRMVLPVRLGRTVTRPVAAFTLRRALDQARLLR
jgi:3-dehydroquinate synthase